MEFCSIPNSLLSRWLNAHASTDIYAIFDAIQPLRGGIDIDVPPSEDRAAYLEQLFVGAKQASELSELFKLTEGLSAKMGSLRLYFEGLKRVSDREVDVAFVCGSGTEQWSMQHAESTSQNLASAMGRSVSLWVGRGRSPAVAVFVLGSELDPEVSLEATRLSRLPEGAPLALVVELVERAPRPPELTGVREHRLWAGGGSEDLVCVLQTDLRYIIEPRPDALKQAVVIGDVADSMYEQFLRLRNELTSSRITVFPGDLRVGERAPRFLDLLQPHRRFVQLLGPEPLLSADGENRQFSQLLYAQRLTHTEPLRWRPDFKREDVSDPYHRTLVFDVDSDVDNRTFTTFVWSVIQQCTAENQVSGSGQPNEDARPFPELDDPPAVGGSDGPQSAVETLGENGTVGKVLPAAAEDRAPSSELERYLRRNGRPRVVLVGPDVDRSLMEQLGHALDEEELDPRIYPSNMSDNEAWAWLKREVQAAAAVIVMREPDNLVDPVLGTQAQRQVFKFARPGVSPIYYPDLESAAATNFAELFAVDKFKAMGAELKRRLPQPVKVFYSYATKNVNDLLALRNELRSPVKLGLIREWFDERMVPGDRVYSMIQQVMDGADVLLFLFTEDYVVSENCNSEVMYATDRLSGKKRLVPLYLRPIRLMDEWRQRLGLSPELWVPPKGATPIMSPAVSSEQQVAALSAAVDHLVRTFKDVQAGGRSGEFQ